MIITDPTIGDNPIVFVNAAFSKLTGYHHDEIIGRNCRFLQGEDTDREDVARLRAAVDGRRSIELDLLNYRKDCTTFWNRLLVSPVFNDDGELTYFFASQFDVTMERERLSRLERDREALEAAVTQRDAELVESEQRLRFALKAGRMGSWSIDVATNRMIASDGFKAIYGQPTAEPMTMDDAVAAVHPDDRAGKAAALARAVEHGTPLDIEYRIRTAAGEERWVQIRGQASYRADGSPPTLIGVSQDVTERRAAEDHRQLLASELSHRVKNSFAMIQAVIGQTLRRASSLEEAGAVLEARIQAMASANDLLTDQRWEYASIRDLIHRTLAPFEVRDPARFAIEGSDLSLPPRFAVALALSLHELATNATKYGALSVPEGSVRLAWQVLTDGSARRLRFSWVEQGGPPVTRPDRAGFGTRLIERTVAGEIGGAATIDYRAEGLVFTAEAPLDTAAGDEASNDDEVAAA